MSAATARHHLAASAGAVLIASCMTQPASTQPLPKRVGQCATTEISDIGTRLNAPGTGSAVAFANGGGQVSYDTVGAIDRSRVGDKVRVCLVSIPEGCPPGDDRGRVYRTTNLRTHKSWELPDASHVCGGA